ncbi:MAG: DUF3341 domain-containing protein [Bdellovibrionales bacterium]|nr:DUF3341 domain-containing protein [Bdellovibrionales bacterium]
MTTTGSKAVVGVFTYHDDAIKAIHQARKAGQEFRVFSPFGCPEICEAAGDNRSPVRFITGTGALIGLVFGFSLAILTSLDWPMRVSAKDVVSVPAFVVVGYECTILFGGLATLLAIFHFCRLPDLLRKVGYDPRFSNDKFGVVVGCDEQSVEQVKDNMLRCGADEVEVREAL